MNTENHDKITIIYTTLEESTKVGQNTRMQNALKNVERELSTLNLNRGGENISKTSGFVFENMHVSDKNRVNRLNHIDEVLEVIDDNGIADFMVKDSKGNISYQQAKKGYTGPNKHKITKEKYAGQKIVTNKGNDELIEYLEKIGLEVEESNITKEMADGMTKVMKTEGKTRQMLGLSNEAPITSRLYVAAEQLKNAHGAGVQAAQGAAAFSAGISFGKNMYEFIEGNIELRELILNTGKDTLVSAVSGYAVGSAGYVASGLLANTAGGVLVSQAMVVVASTEIGAVIVSMGPVIASMSAAVGPAFLVGMAIGTGYAVIKSVKNKSYLYKKKMSEVNKALSQALSSMKMAHDSMSDLLKETNDFWDTSFNEGFDNVMQAISENDFDRFSFGLDTILKVLDSHVLFASMEEFDEFFLDDDAVLIL